MKQEIFVIGVDFGTDSVRSVLIDTKDGRELSSSVFYYPRWKAGLYCNASINQFRQHPADYIEGLEHTIKSCLDYVGTDAAKSVRGISVDTTGSTPIAVDKKGTPLSFLPGFEENPNAMFIIWKDHTSMTEAAEINEHDKKYGNKYLKNVGGIYSSEWFWAKLLHILRVDPSVAGAIESWVEHCDYIPFLLTGGNSSTEIKRSVCAAGHKSLWASEFGGLPPDSYFSVLDPLLSGFMARLFTETYTADKAAGVISDEWALRLGLSTDVIIGIGAFDAHMGAVGGQIEPYQLSKVMGTSTCDMLVAPLIEMQNKQIKGICGQVPGSILPGMLGMEAGQSAFGDTFAWFRNLLEWPLESGAFNLGNFPKVLTDELKAAIHQNLIPALSSEAAKISVTEQSELALDWLNGRRSPDANQELKAAISQLNLASDAPAIFRALAESICFGAKQIVDCFISQGVPIKGIIGLGGVAKKSAFTMQLLADILDLPVRIHRSEQTCAIGAAMFSATIVGAYTTVENAMNAMGQGFEHTYYPNPINRALFDSRYLRFKNLASGIEKIK